MQLSIHFGTASTTRPALLMELARKLPYSKDEDVDADSAANRYRLGRGHERYRKSTREWTYNSRVGVI